MGSSILVWGLGILAPIFVLLGFLSFSFVSASSFSAFNWHSPDFTLAVVLTLVLVGMSVSV